MPRIVQVLSRVLHTSSTKWLLLQFGSMRLQRWVQTLPHRFQYFLLHRRLVRLSPHHAKRNIALQSMLGHMRQNFLLIICRTQQLQVRSLSPKNPPPLRNCLQWVICSGQLPQRYRLSQIRMASRLPDRILDRPALISLHNLTTPAHQSLSSTGSSPTNPYRNKTRRMATSSRHLPIARIRTRKSQPQDPVEASLLGSMIRQSRTGMNLM